MQTYTQELTLQTNLTEQDLDVIVLALHAAQDRWHQLYTSTDVEATKETAASELYKTEVLIRRFMKTLQMMNRQKLAEAGL